MTPVTGEAAQGGRAGDFRQAYSPPELAESWSTAFGKEDWKAEGVLRLFSAEGLKGDYA